MKRLLSDYIVFYKSYSFYTKCISLRNIILAGGVTESYKLSFLFICLCFSLPAFSQKLPTWTRVGGVSSDNVYSLAQNESALYAGTHHGVFKFTDKGGSWTIINDGFPENKVVNALAVNGETLYAGTKRWGSDGKVYRSINNQDKWEIFCGDIKIPPGETRNDILSLAVDGGTVYVGGEDCALLSGNDATWHIIDGSIIDTSHQQIEGIAVTGNNVYYGVWTRGIYKTNLAGGEWTAMDTSPMGPKPRVDVLLLHQEKIYAGTFTQNDTIGGVIHKVSVGGVFEYDIAKGGSWKMITSPLDSIRGVKALTVDGNFLYAGTGGGNVWRYDLTTATEKSWTLIGDRFQSSPIRSLLVRASNLFVGTEKNGLWVLPIDNIPPKAVLSPPSVLTPEVTKDVAVTLKFDEAIQRGTGTLQMIINSGAPVNIAETNIAISTDKTLATITHDPFPAGATVSIVVPKGTFKDATGNDYAGTTADTWKFKVLVDNMAPTAELSPNGLTPEVAANVSVTLKFNEPVQKGVGSIAIRFFINEVEDVSRAILVSDPRLTPTAQNLVTIPHTPFPAEAIVGVVVPKGAFKDIAAVPLDYAGTTADSWKFKVQKAPPQDIEGPKLDISQTLKETDGKQEAKLSVIATDVSGVKDVKLRYKGITASEFSEPVTATLTATAHTYEATIAADKLTDKLGIAYEFVATDGAANANVSKIEGKLLRTYPEGLAIPYTRYGDKVENYELIAIPLDLAAINKVSDVFEELGAPHIEKWRLVVYTPSKTPPFTDLTASSPLKAGEAYWMIAKGDALQPTPLNTGAGKAVATTPFSVALNQAAGLQLIGNPYAFNLSWEDIEAANPGIEERIAAFYVLVDGNYVNIKDTKGILSQLKGAVADVRAASASLPNELIFPVKLNAAINSGGRLAQGRLPAEEGWVTYLSLSNGKKHYDLSGFGMHRKASLELDIHDRLLPPQLGEPFELSFTTPTQAGLPLTQDVVAPQEEHLWELVAQAGNSSSPLALSWQYLPEDGKGVWLYDEQAGEIVDMRIQSSYSYKGKGRKLFKIFYGDKEQLLRALAIREPMLLSVSPNPFREQTLIPFTLPEQGDSYQVEVAIYNLSGEKVTTLVNHTYSAGMHAVAWDGKDAAGGRVSQGMYLCRFTATTKGKTAVYTSKIIFY